EQVVDSVPPVVEEGLGAVHDALPVASEERTERLPDETERFDDALPDALEELPSAPEDVDDLAPVLGDDGAEAKEVGRPRGDEKPDGCDDPPYGAGQEADGGADAGEQSGHHTQERQKVADGSSERPDHPQDGPDRGEDPEPADD